MKKKFSFLVLSSILLQQVVTSTNLIYATQPEPSSVTNTINEEIINNAHDEENTRNRLTYEQNNKNRQTEVIYDSMELDPNIPEEDLNGIALSNSKHFMPEHETPSNTITEVAFNPLFGYGNSGISDSVKITSVYHTVKFWGKWLDYTNLFSNVKTITPSDGIERFVMYTNDSSEVKQYRIIQDGTIVAASSSNILYLDTSKLIPNKKVYVQLLLNNGQKSSLKSTNLTVVAKVFSEFTGDLPLSQIFPSKFGFEVSSSIPLLGGEWFEMGFKGLGLKETSLNIDLDDKVNYKPDKLEKDFKFATIDLDASITGSGYGSYDSYKDLLELGAKFSGEINGERIWTLPTIYVVSVPIYIQAGLYGNGEISVAIDAKFEDISKGWSPDIDISKSGVSVSGGGILGAGVGFPKVASLGVEGRLGLRYVQPFYNYRNNSVYMDINAYIRFKLGWFTIKKDLYSRSQKIYPSNRSAADFQYFDDEEMIFSMTELKSPKTSRNFMPILSDSQSIIDNYVSDQSKPKLLVHNGMEYAFWIDYDENADSFPNGARLVYAYRSIGEDIWSDFIIIDDDGTNDFDYDVAITDDNKIHIVWQNATERFDEDETFTLDEIGNLMEINYKVIEAQNPYNINLLSIEMQSNSNEMPESEYEIETPTSDVLVPTNLGVSNVQPNTPGNMLPDITPNTPGNMLPDINDMKPIDPIPGYDEMIEVGYESTADGAFKISGGKFGAMPTLAVYENEAHITWVENTENAVFLDKGTNYVMSIKVNDLVLEKTPSIIYITKEIPYNMDAEYINGEHITLYSADTDGDIETDADREIFYVKNGIVSQVTHNDYFEDLPKLVKNNGDVTAFWASKDNIYQADDVNYIESATALFETPIDIDGDGFEVISDGNDITILWKNKTIAEDVENQQDIMTMSEEELKENIVTKIMARHLEHGTWTESYTILETTEDISLANGYQVDDENIAVLYSTYDTTNDEVSSQLIYDTLTKKSNIKLNSVTTYDAALSGQKFKLDVTLSNTGAFDIDDVEIEIQDQKGDVIYSRKLEVEDGLGIGERKTIEINDFVIPDDLDGMEIYKIKIQTDNDDNEIDNIKEITVGDVDLGVEIDRYVIEEQTFAQVKVFNNSTITTNATIELRANNTDGELIDTIEVSDINVEGDQYYTMNLNTLLTEKGQKIPETIHFNIVDEDSINNNNTDFVVMNIVNYDSESSYEENTSEDYSSEDEFEYYEQVLDAEHSLINNFKAPNEPEISSLSTKNGITTFALNLRDKDIAGTKVQTYIDNSKLRSIIKTLLNEANKENTKKTPVLVINIDGASNANQFEVELDSNTLANLLDNNLSASLEIHTEIGRIILDYYTLNELTRLTKNQDLLFKFTNSTEYLNAKQKELAKNNPVYKFTIEADGTPIEQFHNNIEIKLDYNLSKDDVNTVKVYYIHEFGKSPELPSEYTQKFNELSVEINSPWAFIIESN